MEKKSSLDPSLEQFYAGGTERDRLSTHRLEFDRTLRILKNHLPSPPATILDVGGAAGAYAFPLTKMGYQVHLIDPMPLHIDQAKENEKKSGCKLASCAVGDARKIERADASADAVLFFGPLYHLFEQKDRLSSLREAHRVLKPGGLLFAVGISRFASLMDAMHKGTLYNRLKIIENDFATGEHRKSAGEFSTYLHLPKDLKAELEKSGFENVTLKSIEGPVWEKGVLNNLQQDHAGWERLLDLLEIIESEESILGASAHMMAIGRRGV